MYLDFWKLIRSPFDQRVNPRWFFASPHHRGTLVYLHGLVERRAPLALLAGGPGVGKSMVAAVLGQTLVPSTFPVVHLQTVPVSTCDLLQKTIHELEAIELPVAPNAQRKSAERRMPADERSLAAWIREHLAARRQAGQHLVWVLESVDAFADDELQHVVSLARSLGRERSTAATVLLVATSTLVARFPRTVALGHEPIPVCVLESMTEPETAGFISHRMRLAGGSPAVFTANAVELIHDLTAGVPRHINRLCDLCLLAAYGEGTAEVQDSHVWAAQDEHGVLCGTRSATVPWPQHRRSYPLVQPESGGNPVHPVARASSPRRAVSRSR